jgi:hypothetical protein
MSNPESPTTMGSSNSARMPASLTSLHNPWKAGPPVTKSTLNPVAMRGSRYTNLRMLSRSLIAVRPSCVVRRDKHAGELDPLYLSARNPVFSIHRLNLRQNVESHESLLSCQSSLSTSIIGFLLRPYWPIKVVTVTSMVKSRYAI